MVMPPKAPPETRYFVQVGVFRSKDNVLNILQRLERIGVSAVTEDYEPSSNGIKRVLAGPYKTRESAGVTLNRISNIGVPGLIVERK